MYNIIVFILIIISETISITNYIYHSNVNKHENAFFEKVIYLNKILIWSWGYSPRFALNMYTLPTNILINAGCTFVLVISVRDALYKWLTSTHAVWVKSTACHVMCNTWVCYLLKKGINNVLLYLAIYIVLSIFIVFSFLVLSIWFIWSLFNAQLQ